MSEETSKSSLSGAASRRAPPISEPSASAGSIPKITEVRFVPDVSSGRSRFLHGSSCSHSPRRRLSSAAMLRSFASSSKRCSASARRALRSSSSKKSFLSTTGRIAKSAVLTGAYLSSSLSAESNFESSERYSVEALLSSLR